MVPMRRCLEADDLVELLESSEKVIRIAVPGPMRDPGVREALAAEEGAKDGLIEDDMLRQWSG